jgi:pimeloyl-ACP methyl ester carboxylesterase
MAESARIEPPYNALPLSMQQYRLWAMRHPKCPAPADNFLAEEIAAIYSSRRENPRPLGSLPLVVITGTQGDVPPGADTTAWRQEKADHMKDLAQLSGEGRLISDPHAGHHVQLDDPTAVVAAIQDVLRVASPP